MADENVADRNKVCTKCGEAKPATREYFTRQVAGKLGLAARCLLCARLATKAWQNTPEGKAARLAWRARPENREKDRRYDRARWRDRPDVRGRKNAQERERNKDTDRLARRAAQARARRQTREAKEKAAEFNRTQKRREWRRNWQKKYFFERERRDPQFKLRLRMGTAIREALQARGESKRRRKWEDLVGYSVADLRRHLERQFTKGMCWASYGEWHIDHIRPIASFKYETADDPAFRECWALSNLRPLWSMLNSAKGAKRIFLL